LEKKLDKQKKNVYTVENEYGKGNEEKEYLSPKPIERSGWWKRFGGRAGK